MSRVATAWVVCVATACGGTHHGGAAPAVERSASAPTPVPAIETACRPDDAVHQPVLNDTEPEPALNNTVHHSEHDLVGGGGLGEGTIGLGRLRTIRNPPRREPPPDSEPPLLPDCPPLPRREGPYVVRCSEDFWTRETCVSFSSNESRLCGHVAIRRVDISMTGATAQADVRLRNQLRRSVEYELRRCWETSAEQSPPDIEVHVVVGTAGNILVWQQRGQSDGAVARCAQQHLPGDLQWPPQEAVKTLVVTAHFFVRDADPP